MIKKFLVLTLTFPEYLISRLIMKLNNASVGNGSMIYGLIKISNKGTITIGKDCIIYCSPRTNKIGANLRTQIYCSQGGYVSIGDKCEISNMLINCQKRVTIGSYVMIGGGTIIWDSNFHSIKYEKRMSKNDDDVKTREVIIEDGVFIGANTIIKCCKIGKKSVIGAGSVVMHDIPEGECWAGNPAKFIKKIY